MKKTAILLIGAAFIAAATLVREHPFPEDLHDALASSQDSAAELGAAFQRFKNRGASEVPSVAGVALETTPPQTEARREISRQLIPEVLNLKKDQLIPHSLFDKYSTNAIAESLVERLYRMAPKPTDPAPADDTVDMWMETELHLFMNSKRFVEVVKTGLKNSFQLDAERNPGEASYPGRNEAERRLAGLKFIEGEKEFVRWDTNQEHRPELYWDAKTNALRPKYGLVFFPSLGRNVNKAATDYGDFILIFNNRIKLRSTWTTDDSRDRLYRDGYLDSGKTFWNRVPKSEILQNQGRYFELQIFGDIAIEDVQAVGIMIMPKSHPDFNYRGVKSSRFHKFLINAGFRVVAFELDLDGYTVSYRKGITISEGDPVKLARWIREVRAGEIAEPVSDEKAR